MHYGNGDMELLDGRITGAPIMLWPIIGVKVSADYRPITDCLFQDASSFNKSHIVTIFEIE